MNFPWCSNSPVSRPVSTDMHCPSLSLYRVFYWFVWADVTFFMGAKGWKSNLHVVATPMAATTGLPPLELGNGCGAPLHQNRGRQFAASVASTDSEKVEKYDNKHMSTAAVVAVTDRRYFPLPVFGRSSWRSWIAVICYCGCCSSWC